MLTLRDRFAHTGAQVDLDAALSAYAEAIEVDSAAPSTRIEAARDAASLAADSQPTRAADLMERAVRLLPDVAPRQLECDDQQYAIGRFPRLGADAAALALADTSMPADQRAVRALRLLESSRAVLLSQVLHTRDGLSELHERYPDLATRFVELRDLLDRPSDPSAWIGTLPESAGFTRPSVDSRWIVTASPRNSPRC